MLSRSVQPKINEQVLRNSILPAVSVARPKPHNSPLLLCVLTYHRTSPLRRILSEPLLTPEETNAILSKWPLHASAGNSSTEAAAGAAGEEGYRREAEALGVLLGEDGLQLEGPIGDVDDRSEKKAAEAALTRLAARYLVRETARGKILDPVGNFHVRKL